jgi:DNA-binding Lrp family transcriptional regulator
MSKSSKEQQVEDERKILVELQKNCNENIDSIAKRCGFSRQKVWRTIKQLEKSHLIWGYTAIVDEEKNDTLHFIMLIKRSLKPLDKKIRDRIETMKLEDIALPLGVNVESSCFVHGCYDWIISFSTTDITQAKNFCNILSGGFPGVIEQIDLQQTLYFVRKHHIFNPDRKKLSDLM